MIRKIDRLIGFLITIIMALSSAILPAVTIMAADPVDLVLSPAVQTVQVGDTFEVIIQAKSGNQEVVGIDAYLDFDPTKLAVIDMNSGQTGIQISDGTILNLPLWNSVNNSTGHIDYSAGAFRPYPRGTFTLATIRFQALAATSPTTTVNFSTSFERPTMVMGDTQASNVTGDLTGGTVTLNPAISSPVPSDGGSSGTGGNSSNVVQAVTIGGLQSPTNLTVDDNGVVKSTTQLVTTDGRAALDITAGTALLNSTGNPLSILTAEAVTTFPPIAANNVLISGYTFSPSGATFNPALVLSLSYDPADLPEGVVETGLYIAYYDGTSWQELESTVDPLSRTVSARISHFSVYAVIGKTTTETSLAFSASATPPVTPSDSDLPPGGDTASLDQPEITPTTIGNQNEGPTSEQDTAPMTPATMPSSTPTPQSNRGGWLIITSIMFALVLVIILTDVIMSRKRANR